MSFKCVHMYEYYHNIYSNYGEDGLLFCIFRLIGWHKVPVFVNLSNMYTRKNMFLNLIKMFKFVSSVPMTFNDGKVECTLAGAKALYSNLRYSYIDLLHVNTDGMEYWMLKTFLQECEGVDSKPNVIVCKINSIIGSRKPLTVPYVPPAKRGSVFDANYVGTSVAAVHTLLKSDYEFVGTTQYATHAVYVKARCIPGPHTGDPSGLKTTFHLPTFDEYFERFNNVQYGIMRRWPLVQSNFWVTVR